MKRCAPLAAALAAVVLVTACSDDAPPPTEPDAADRLRHDITADPDLGGLFFFGPPVGTREDRAAGFDATQLPVLVLEICLEGNLDSGADPDPLTAVCSDPLARFTSEAGHFGREIFLSEEDGEDWYQVNVPFGHFDRADDLEQGGTYFARVSVGTPEGEAGTDFRIYGAFDFVIVGNRGRRGSPGGGPPAGPRGGGDDPMEVVARRTLPVKWFLGEGAVEGLLCESNECTAEVFTSEEGGTLCFPEEDCGSGEATAGVDVEGAVLPRDVVVTIEEDDPDQEFFGIPNPRIRQAANISTTPAIPDFSSFDNDGDGSADIVVQLCYFVDDPDPYATFRSTPAGAERLPFDPRGDFIFSSENCEDEEEVGLGEGLVEKARLALRSKVLRPLGRVMGPKPLRAGDRSFTADTRGFSTFLPAVSVELSQNEAPPALLPPSESPITVPISVCVEGIHPGSLDGPQPAPGVDVTFEVVSADGSTVTPTTATSQLESASGENGGAACDVTPDENGNVAVARTEWELPAVEQGSFQARAFLDGDFALSVQANGGGEPEPCDLAEACELGDLVFEVFFETEVAPSNGEPDPVVNVTGSWSGLYEWDCGSSLTGSAEITFELVQSGLSVSGTVSYLGGSSSVSGTVLPEDMTVLLEWDGSSAFVLNQFTGELDDSGLTIAGTTLNGDSPVDPSPGCSAPVGPSGTISISR